MLARLLALLFTALCASPSRAAVELSETLPSGAVIRIAAPDDWQAGDGLVLFQHGFNMEFDDDPELGPWQDLLLAEGYAVGASGYRMAGWALFSAVEDNRDLLAFFRGRFGEPGALITMGGSMGGLIALKIAESPGFENTRGVLSVCPPASGARTWDAAIDLRMAYDAVCQGVGGGELPLGEAPLTWAYDLDDIPGGLGDLLDSGDVIRTLARVTQCTGVTLPPALRSNSQRERLAKLMQFGKFTSEDFFIATMGYATFAMSDLIRAPEKLNGANPFSTEGVDYGDELINARVPRFAGDPWARFRLHQVSDLNGALPDSTRVLVLHTSKDELVRPVHQNYLRLEADYRSNTAPPAEQLFAGLVSEAENTHCGFTAAELGAGWLTLKRAMSGQTVDTPTFQGQCQVALQAGLEGPCRVNGEPAISELLDETMRPRPAQTIAQTSARNAGMWIDPGLIGEGFYVEPLSDDRAVVSGYSYPALGDGGEQLWWVGIGRIDGNGITLPDIALYRGPRFQDYHADDLRAQGFGSAELVFLDRQRADIRLDVPARYGRPNRQLNRLSEHPLIDLPTTLQLPYAPSYGLAGIYVAPTRQGEGLILHHMPMLDDEQRLTQRDFLIWYTFDQQGDPMWLIGERSQPLQAGVEPGTWHYPFTLRRAVGTFYPPNFNSNDVSLLPFGTVKLDNLDCRRMQVRVDARAGGFGELEFIANRITATNNSPCVWE